MSEKPKDTRTVPIEAKWPSGHIQGLGLGTVGTIYITLTNQDEIIRAKAELFDAPFKRMIIDDPDILRIFGPLGSEINFNVLKHPLPRFHLDPLGPLPELDEDLGDWGDVGRLIDVTYVSMASQRAAARAKSGTWKDGAVYKAIEKTVQKLNDEKEKEKAKRQQRPRKKLARKTSAVDTRKKQMADAAQSETFTVNDAHVSGQASATQDDHEFSVNKMTGDMAQDNSRPQKVAETVEDKVKKEDVPAEGQVLGVVTPPSEMKAEQLTGEDKENIAEETTQIKDESPSSK